MWLGQFFAALVVLARWVVPIAFIMVAFVVENIPVLGEHSQALIPMFGVMSVIAFSIRKMGIMPPWLVFLLMLWAELYASAVPGTLIIPAMVVRFILLEQREFFSFAPFFAVWAGVSVILFLFSGLHFLTIAGFYVALFEPTDFFIRTCISAALYPAVAGLVFWVDSILWPDKQGTAVDEDRGIQFLPIGMRLPTVSFNKKRDLTRESAEGRSKKSSIFRRIRRSKTAKPWMEL